MKAHATWMLWGGIVLIGYSLVAGLAGKVPQIPILYESIRNFYYHVPMWFAMLAMFLIGVVYSLWYLSSAYPRHDHMAAAFIETGIVFGLLGLITGAIWARYTWGAWWNNDPKQNASAIVLLIYIAYFVLRHAITDASVRGRVGAVYSTFAFAVAIPLLFILPRMTDSLHPGSGGNPAFSSYDLDYQMRLVFYPAVIGWILFGSWLSHINGCIRVRRQQLTILQID